MKAWVCRQYVDPYEINFDEVPARAPKDDEVQVGIHAAGINFGETLVLTGNYQVKPPLPYIFGVEGAGVVLACGPRATRFKPGDGVIVLNADMTSEGGGGCCAEILTTREKWLYPKPDNIDFPTAASFLANYGTTYHGLVRRGQVKAGEVLVVHGASGGVGLAAVQLGKVLGATVIATGGDDEKLKIVRKHGADYTIDYNKEPLRERILEITGGRGADVFYDPVGGDMFEASMRAIAPGGRILIVGFTSGQHVKAATNIILVKMISIIGVEFRAFTKHHPDLAREDYYSAIDLVAKGLLKPYYNKAFPLSGLKEAIAFVKNRQVVGKCILVNENPAS